MLTKAQRPPWLARCDGRGHDSARVNIGSKEKHLLLSELGSDSTHSILTPVKAGTSAVALSGISDARDKPRTRISRNELYTCPGDAQVLESEIEHIRLRTHQQVMGWG